MLKKNVYICFLSIIISLASYAQTSSIPDWENPFLVSLNTEKPHVTMLPFDSEAKALKNLWSESTNYLSLNGTWKFSFADNPMQAPRDFFLDSYNYSDWKNIEVPSTWEVQGYSYPIYVNVRYEFFTQNPIPPQVPHNYNPVGSYLKEFSIPQDWDNKQVLIHLGAVKSFFYIWLNGKYLGFSKDSKTPAEFDLTPYLRKGNNRLALQVYRWNDGSYLECQDMWRMSGINRDVYLFAKPQLNIRDFFVHAGLTDNYTNGLLNIDLLMEDKRMESFGKSSIQVKLYDPEKPGTALFSESIQLAAGKLQNDSIRFSRKITAPKLWSARDSQPLPAYLNPS
ncbi:MAG: hypothetical protein IPH88_05455 [Bacteroidales bacterium]|nr:hypothetical protein [Bacteroidales bacterium]